VPLLAKFVIPLALAVAVLFAAASGPSKHPSAPHQQRALVIHHR
jgi:hypothetical protein